MQSKRPLNTSFSNIDKLKVGIYTEAHLAKAAKSKLTTLNGSLTSLPSLTNGGQNCHCDGDVDQRPSFGDQDAVEVLSYYDVQIGHLFVIGLLHRPDFDVIKPTLLFGRGTATIGFVTVDNYRKLMTTAVKALTSGPEPIVAFVLPDEHQEIIL